MKVDFMIIGAMKSGTSSLAALLARHPDVCFSNPKEPGYFNRKSNWRKALHQYEKYFEHKKAKFYAEGSTDYTKIPVNKPGICNDLYEYNPQLKFIYLVRHPVPRAVSHYMHLYRRGYTNDGFSRALEGVEIISVGQYYRQISPYIEKFGRDRVLILKFEDFIAQQWETMKIVCQFLDLDFIYPQKMKNAMNNTTVGVDVLNIRHEWFFSNFIAPLGGILPADTLSSIREWLRRLNRKRTFDRKLSVTEEEQQVILQKTSSDTRQLQEIVDFDLSDYLLPAPEGSTGAE